MIETKILEKEIITATLSIPTFNKNYESSIKLLDDNQISLKLNEANNALERYTNKADRLDYAFAIACGILAGLIDSIFVGEFSLEKAHEWGTEKTEKIYIASSKTTKVSR